MRFFDCFGQCHGRKSPHGDASVTPTAFRQVLWASGSIEVPITNGNVSSVSRGNGLSLRRAADLRFYRTPSDRPRDVTTSSHRASDGDVHARPCLIQGRLTEGLKWMFARHTEAKDAT